MLKLQHILHIETNRLNHYVRGKTSTFINEGAVYVSDGTQLATQTPFEKSVTFTEFPDSRINFYSTGTKHTHDHLPDPHGAGGKVTTGSITDDDPLQFNFRQMQQRHDRYLQLQIVIHGFSGLQVGDSITLDVPTTGSQAQSDAGWDPRFSSDTFYITRLVHRIDVNSANGYECVLDISPMKGGRDPIPAGGKHNRKSDQGPKQAVINQRRQRERNQEAD